MCAYSSLPNLAFVGSLSVILNSPPVEWSNLVAVGHNLYAINKEDDASCSSNVFFLDCQTHTWVETPSLRFAHTIPGIDGMMYLAGSYKNPDSLKCVEVFNTETQTWKPVPLDKRISTARDFQGNKCFPYKAKGLYKGLGRVCYLLFDRENILSGGKMVVFWDKYVPARGGYKEKMIWCAEISLEMRSSEEVWGKVEWFDAVLTVPKSYKFVYAIAATV
ncbi:hypothetical protein Bca4012_018972 [Brassica carinata]